MQVMQLTGVINLIDNIYNDAMEIPAHKEYGMLALQVNRHLWE